MAAMRNAACRRPSISLQYLERALVLAQSVRERAVELKPVAVGAHSTVAQQIACILMTEEVLAGGHRTSIELRECRLQMVVERIARFLVPEQRIVAEHLRVSDRRFEIEAPVRIDGQLCSVADLVEHRFDALPILVERCTADLHLDDAVAALEIAAHLGAQRIVGLAGIVIAAGGVDEYAWIRLHGMMFGEQPKQRLAGD